MRNFLFVIFILISGLFTALIILFESSNIQVISSISITVVIATLYVSGNHTMSDSKFSFLIFNPLFDLIDSFEKKNSSWYSLSIVVLSAIVGILSILLLVQRLNFNSLESTGIDTANLIIVTNLISIILVQVGGWILQSFMIHFLAVVFNGSKPIGSYFKIVGLSYTGFLIGAVISLFYSLFTLPTSIPIEEFNSMMNNSLVPKLIGKNAEFISLILIAYGLCKLERFTLFKSLLITLIPSVVLILLKILFIEILT